MQRLEVSGAVRPIYVSLGVKRLNRAQNRPLEDKICGILKPGVLASAKMGQSLKLITQLHIGAEVAEWCFSCILYNNNFVLVT